MLRSKFFFLRCLWFYEHDYFKCHYAKLTLTPSEGFTGLKYVSYWKYLVNCGSNNTALTTVWWAGDSFYKTKGSRSLNKIVYKSTNDYCLQMFLLYWQLLHVKTTKRHSKTSNLTHVQSTLLSLCKYLSKNRREKKPVIKEKKLFDTESVGFNERKLLTEDTYFLLVVFSLILFVYHIVVPFKACLFAEEMQRIYLRLTTAPSWSLFQRETSR